MLQRFCVLIPLAFLVPGAALAQSDPPPEMTAEMTAETPEIWLPGLQTDTAQQGFDLAISMARRAVRTTQPDTDVLKAERPDYAADADSLIGISGVAAAWFATIAAANDYWRE